MFFSVIFLIFLSYSAFAVETGVVAPSFSGVADQSPSLAPEAQEADAAGEALFGYDEDDYVEDKNRLQDFSGTVYLKEVRFHGNKIIKSEDLQELAKPYIGVKVGFTELNQLKKKIYDFCSKKGLLFHRVLLPTQEVNDGDVDFFLRETSIKQIALKAAPKVRQRIMTFVQKLQRAVTAAEYEKQFLLMQRLPGYKVTAVVSPLEDNPTYLMMDIRVVEDKFHASIGGSNTLLKKAVGPWMSVAGFNFDNIFGLNEHLELSGQAVSPVREMAGLSATLSLPLGYQGFSVTGGWSHHWTEPSIVSNNKRTERPSGQPSTRRRVKLGASLPVYLRFGSTVSLEGAYYWFKSGSKNFDPSIAISQREIPITEEEENYAYFRGKMRIKKRSGVVSNVFLISGSYQPQVKNGEVLYDYINVDGNLTKTRNKTQEQDIERARAVYLSYTMFAALPKGLGVSLLFGGQWSFDPRRGLDLYRPVGDARTTYAYPIGTIAGESGMSTRLSISKNLKISKQVVVAPYVYATYGAAWRHKKHEGLYDYVDLHSWGLGLECSVMRNLSIKAEYAHPLGSMHNQKLIDKIPDTKDKRFVFSVNMSV